MRDALYLVGIARSNHRTVQKVKEAYRLPALIATEAALAPVAEDAVRRRLRDAITATEEAWNRFSAGTTQALPVFRANAATLVAVAEETTQPDFLRLTRAIAEVASFLGQSPARHSEALAMENATAILLAQNAQENLQYLDSSFTHQVDVMAARIRDCIAGTPLPPESELPALDEMSRQAQEKMLIGQVAREITNNLAQIEQVLDGFFRDAERRGDLVQLDAPLRQVIGALTMMRHDGAVAVLRHCTTEVARFSAPAYEPQQADFERLAEQLSLVGFFVDAMQTGCADFEAFVNRMRAGGEPAEIEAEAATVEQEVEQQKREAHALLVALKEQPSDAALRQEVTQNLTALQKDADLVADKELGLQAKHVLSALAAGGDAAPQIEAAMATLKPDVPVAPPPSAETIQLSQATVEEFDAELLGIFLEEADDVLSSIQDNLGLLHRQPHDVEALTALRRSVHTLKGSGRMVGLKDLGEAAWSVEQVLNLWLRQELEVTPQLLDLLGQACTAFSAWVEHLKTGLGEIPDVSRMCEAAAALRDGDEAELAATAGAGATASVADRPASEVAAKTPVIATEPATVPERSRLSIAPALLGIFRDESATHLVTLQREFALLEEDLTAPSSHEMYRAAHTLAGIAGTVGLAAIKHLGHALELALVRRNHATGRDSLAAFETVRQAIAELALMLADVAREHEPEPIPSLLVALDSLYPELAVEEPVEAAPCLDEKETAAELVRVEPTVVPAAPAPAVVAAPADAPAVQDEFDEQLLPLFIEEAIDLNQNIAAQLRAWRSNPADPEPVRRLARLFHSLKGSARMAGAMSLGNLTHAIETRMKEAQDAGAAPIELIDDIDNAFDVIIQVVERLQRGETADTPLEISDTGTLDPVGETATDAAAAAAEVEQPIAAGPRPEAQETEAEAAAQRANLRVRADLIDRLVNEAGELSIARLRIEGEMRGIKASLLDLTENVIRLRRQLREIEIQAELQMQSRTAVADEQHADFDPLEFDRFTRFQELTRMMAESVNDVATVQQNLLKNLDDANAAIIAQARLNREVQQELMSVRMVPFASIADRLYRIVRQASKDTGKRANLEIRGAQLELDRSVLDKMLAPLEHVLRNAVAHGLEDAPLRRARGKADIGEIALTLVQEGNEVILSIADDGTGLDLERLRERGLHSGMLSSEDADKAERVIDLIFAPGISTATQVSQLAGRGIGMDVLKSEVTSLGGRIEVFSTAGQGTTFRLYLPLTLAVTKALLAVSHPSRHDRAGTRPQGEEPGANPRQPRGCLDRQPLPVQLPATSPRRTPGTAREACAVLGAAVAQRQQAGGAAGR